MSKSNAFPTHILRVGNLEKLTGNISQENVEVECKARLDRSNPQSWIKTVGGFSNAADGTFYIGAEDKTFKLISFTRKDADNERNDFNNQINEHVSPRPQYDSCEKR